MDSDIYHYLKCKVTHLESAVFADNITKIIMSLYEIPWCMEFASEENHSDFVDIYEEDLLLDMETVVREVIETLNIDPTLWQLDEDTFSKLLHDLRLEFIAESSKSMYLLLETSSKMLYYAIIYYQRGLKEAPIVAFLHVYRLDYIYYKPGR